MTNEELKAAITERFAAVTYDETGEFLTAFATLADFRNIIETFRKAPEFHFDYLFCLTCIDWKTHLAMVYHLFSRNNKHTLVLKVKLEDLNNPHIETVSDIWKTANAMEREVYDLFGVKFDKHPDLRRLFLDDNWPGFPLRKNYVDENMISL